MKKYIFAAFVTALSVTCFASYSFGIDKGKKLLELGGDCFVIIKDCDLSGARLNGADLMKKNLAKANLSGANLTKANLFQANLSGANLTEANLTNALLFGANLTGASTLNAKISGAIFCKTKTPWGLDNSGCK